MKKSVSKNRSKTKRALRMGKTSTRAKKVKKPTALQKANEVKKAMRARLRALKEEFKNKLKLATEKAYEKANADMNREQAKKAEAKSKILAAADAKFEKKYTTKLQKKTKPKRRKMRAVGTIGKAKSTKRRGRPPKKLGAK